MSYGDVAVFGDNQTADIRDYKNRAGFPLWTIHPEDKVIKTGEENEPWQFAFTDPHHEMDRYTLPLEGYRYVDEKEWTVPHDSRFRWNSEGKLEFMGQVLMYRPVALYFEANDARRLENQENIASAGMELAAEADKIGVGLEQRIGGETRTIVKPKSKLSNFFK